MGLAFFFVLYHCSPQGVASDHTHVVLTGARRVTSPKKLDLRNGGLTILTLRFWLVLFGILPLLLSPLLLKSGNLNQDFYIGNQRLGH